MPVKSVVLYSIPDSWLRADDSSTAVVHEFIHHLLLLREEKNEK